MFNNTMQHNFCYSHATFFFKCIRNMHYTNFFKNSYLNVQNIHKKWVKTKRDDFPIKYIQYQQILD